MSIENFVFSSVTNRNHNLDMRESKQHHKVVTRTEGTKSVANIILPSRRFKKFMHLPFSNQAFVN